MAVLLTATAITPLLATAASAGESGGPANPAATTASASTSTAASASATGQATAGSPVQWALKSLDATALWRRSLGAGARIAVVDTGMNLEDPDLAGVPINVRDVASGRRTHVPPGSHGTDIAELIAGNGKAGVTGFAPKASLIDIRVAAQPSKVTAADIAAGITAAVEAGAEVINVSLGVRDDSPALLAAVTGAERHGRLVVASAGGSGTPLYPAGISGVLSVGAEGQRGNLAKAPPGTALYAPGIGVVQNAAAGITALDGSDFAAAYVSAAAALLLSPGLPRSGRQLTPLDAGSDLTATAGASKLLDPVKALERALPPQPTPRPSPTPAANPPASGPSLLAGVLYVVLGLAAVGALALILVYRRTNRAARRPAWAGATGSRPARSGESREALPPVHEPFSWDHTW